MSVPMALNLLEKGTWCSYKKKNTGSSVQAGPKEPVIDQLPHGVSVGVTSGGVKKISAETNLTRKSQVFAAS